jgi:Ni/Co efflux regulator RcnB
MKRLAIAVLAAATFAAPLAIAPDAAAQRHRGDHDRRWDGDRDRDRDYRRDNRRDRRADRRRDRREDRRAERWDNRRYNGYNYRGRWHYGPPPAAYRDHAYYGYRSWRRGDRLPSYYRSRYVVVRDYDLYGYRHPPRGYHYVRDDRGDLLLVGIATGVILGIIASQ